MDSKKKDSGSLLRTGLLLLVIGAVVIYWGVVSNESFMNIISVIGSLFSFVGVCLAVWQIIQTKSIVQVTNETAVETRETLNDYLSFADVSQMVRIADEVDGLLSTPDTYSVARQRIRSLYEQVMVLSTNPQLDGKCDKKIVKKLLSNLSMDAANLKDMKDYDSLNIKDITSHVDEMKKWLLFLEGNLKYKKL